MVAARSAVLSSFWTRVALSRLLAFGAGAVGALRGAERPWHLFDPQQLTLSLGRVGDVLAASADRWDAVHYVQIARGGYDASNAVFYPLYPLLIHMLAWIVRSDVLAGVIISLIAFVTALELLRRLAIDELGERYAEPVVLLLAFAPVSFFFSAVYTESVFLVLSVGAFYLGRQGRFVLAGVAATAAALTHLEGAILTVPLGLMYWEQHRQRLPGHRLRITVGAALTLPLLAPVAFMLYLSGRGYGLLLPFSEQSNALNDGHQFTGPVVTVIRAISAALSSDWRILEGQDSIGSWIYGSGLRDSAQLTVLAISLAALVVVWRRLPRPYVIYCGLALLVFTSSPAVDDPLESIDRFVLVLFPLWMAAAAWLTDRRLLGRTVAIGGLMLCFYTFAFARWTFVA
jgi:hypothetical protein